MEPVAERISVLVVDDHPAVRVGIVQLLLPFPSVDVAAEAGGVAEALQILHRKRFSVVVTNLGMPGLTGLDLLKRVTLLAGGLPPRVLIYTSRSGPGYVQEAVRLGAKGYLLKRSRPEDLFEAIRSVSRGGTYFGPDVRHPANWDAEQHPEQGPPSLSLSPQQEAVLASSLDHKTNAEIAEALQASPRTVGRWRRAALHQLGIRKPLNDLTDEECARLRRLLSGTLHVPGGLTPSELLVGGD